MNDRLRRRYLIAETYEYGSLKCKIVRDLNTGNILSIKGNPDVAELVSLIHYLAESYHRLMEYHIESIHKLLGKRKQL